jgi:N-acetyl-gamma-glutamyl-phosphate reductase
MTSSVGIVGASGYGGAELLRLLAGHHEVQVEVVAAHSQAGKPVSSLFPNLPGARCFDAIDVDQLGELDLVFLATPHGPSLELAATLHAGGTKVVDLSGAYRLTAEGFANWYGEVHPHPELAPAVYGMPEFFRKDVAGATLVANPGCYVTTALLGLRPLSPLLVPGTVIIDGKSGTSGAGRAAKDHLHHPHLTANLGAYGAPAHRHTGEIEQWLTNDLDGPGVVDLGAVQFTPHLVPMSRGMQTTSYANLREGVSPQDVQQALVETYADEPFVHVLAPGTFPLTKSVVGSNGCQLSALVDPRTNRVVITSVIDNLGKGAAGQALQNANLMLGLDETLGLSAIGVFP